MERDKHLCGESVVLSAEQDELCQLLIESHQAYHDDVLDAGMTYEDFLDNFFGVYKHYGDAYRLFREHQPIIEHRFKSSVFEEEDAMAMLKEFEHSNSFFDRSLIDIQLIPIKQKLQTEGLISKLSACANEIALFQVQIHDSDVIAIMTGESRLDYGIYNVSHFAYFMKELEKHRLLVQHWQAMMAKLSRIVYHGRYITQTSLSTAVNRLSLQMRRPWIYDAIDDWFELLPHTSLQETKHNH